MTLALQSKDTWLKSAHLTKHPGYVAEIERRQVLVEKCHESRLFRRREIQACALNCSYWINNWVWTFDPREEPNDFPFRLFEKQEEFVNFLVKAIEDNENTHTEKSRDMGATWIACAVTVWIWLHRPGWLQRWGSVTATDVDDFTVDSVFGKLRYIVERLPEFWVPSRTFAQKAYNQKQKLVHPINRNVILGEACGLKFGRGGRARVSWLDEFAHVMHSEAAWAAVKQSCKSNNAISTPNVLIPPDHNMFHWLRHKSSLRKFRLHWRDDPRKDQAWYDKEKSEMKEWQVAQEIDISYEPHLEGRIFHNYDESLHVAKKEIQADPVLEQVAFWDFGFGVHMALGLAQIRKLPRPGAVVEVWNYLQMTEKDIDFFLHLLYEPDVPPEYYHCRREEQAAIKAFMAKLPQDYQPDHYGDFAGTQRTANSRRSCRDAIEDKSGKRFHCTVRQDYLWRVECATDMFKPCPQPSHGPELRRYVGKVQISPELEKLKQCFRNYVWDNPLKGKPQPKIDEYSHGATAFEFLAINRFPKDRVRDRRGRRRKSVIVQENFR